MNSKLLALAAVAALGLTVTVASADTLADVKARGFLQCGVSEGTAGFETPDANNEWAGIDVDYCRAIAAAIFNDPKAVRFTTSNSTVRWQQLGSREVDVLARTSTWTMTRDTTLGLTFVAPIYYDGQGFMVHKATGIKSALELGGATLCIEAGTTTELNAADYFAANKMEYNPVTFVSQDEAYKAYEEGRCDAFTTDRSALAGNRLLLAVPDDHVVLPEVISKEPLTSVVRQGDDLWFKINRWVFDAMLEAEELGVTSQNVDQMLASENPGIKRLLGVEGDFGTPLGLTKEWAYQVIKHVGNYAEIFDRNVGKGSAVGLERGINALWKDGGIQYSPPIR
ncbi:MAG: amino acid ABC transporter substrate-binding protein [Devosia sp.]